MPRFGGLTPYPSRFGGKGPQGVRVEEILRSLNAQRGSAYDTTPTSTVYAENMATARVLSDIWSTNQRMANQYDAARITTSLSRWEGILALAPAPGDPDQTRRARIQAVWSRTGQSPFTAYVITQLQAALGPVFVALEFISASNAVINVPNGSYPFGAANAVVPWSSTVAQLLIRTQLPSNYRETDFLASVSKINPLLDAIMPAWTTWTWYRPPTNYAPIAVTGGPSAGGFYLDDYKNLDYEVFSA